MRKGTLLAGCIILYLAFSVFATYVSIEKIIDKYEPEDEKVDFFVKGETNLIVGDIHIKGYSPPVVSGSEILLPFDFVKDYIDSTVYKETDGSVITITSEDKVIRMRESEAEAYVNMEPLKLDIPVRHINGELYMPIMVFRDLFGIEVVYHEDFNVVIVDFIKNYTYSGFVSPVTENKNYSKSVAVRSGMSIKKPIYKEIGLEGEQVEVYETDGLWAKIRTREGIIGYIESRFMKSSVTHNDIKVDLIRRTPGELEKIILVWQYIYEITPPAEEMEELSGINVYSPTWFTVTKNDGTLDNRADMPYVEKVHEMGAQIWPLVNNTFNDINMTSEVLNNPDARDNIIRQLLAYAQLYNLDGINMDFENIYLKDKDAYTQLVRELMPYARKMGLKISVDVGIPGGSDNYSLCYDHKRLSDAADYIMVMTYDQHWSSSSVAGSQAQLAWVDQMLALTLESVNPDKLLVGIPFYTRIWKETEGEVKNIKTVGMDRAWEIIEEKQAKVEWDEESGQYYASYTEEGALYRMWVEDKNSVALKAELVVKYNLRGVAVWQLSLGNEEAWESIEKAIEKQEEQ